MIRLNKTIFILITGILFSVNVSAQQVVPFTEEKSAAFANYLFQTNQYQYASEEYERLLFFFPDNIDYKLKLIKSYRLSENYSKGITVCKKYLSFNQLPSKPILIEYTKLNILDNNYPEIKMLLGTLNTSDSLRSNIDLASRLIFLSEKNLNTDGIDLKIVDANLINLYNESFKIKHKSPALAGFMSAVVPGSGKFYTNRWKDGLIALVFVGATGYQTYRGFNQKGVKSAYGWILGGVACSFYIGNIYGSVKSAKNYNLSQRSKYVESVSDYFIEHY